MKVLVMFVVCLPLLWITSCSDSESTENEEAFLQSSTYGSKSHNTGSDCMQCHKKGGGAKGIFTVAGSVYQLDKSRPNPNGLVFLSALANGREQEVQLNVDGLGNFYTTETVAFGKGLYPQHKSSKDTIRYMNDAITNGSCNSCHGRTTDVIYNY
ncbi:MAG: hypothetical protein U0Y96_00225 [Candidatus Kapaibacterium sp.]